MTRLFVVRHGMRIDHENKQWGQTAERSFDPPLSETGMIEAHETGKYLAQFGIEAMYASPLLRTIQTATEITRTLDLDIRVESGLVEWLNPKWHDFTAGFLPLSDLKAEHARLDLTYRSLINPRYPEQDEETCAARATFVARQLVAEQNGAGDVLLVTHGVCVLRIVEALTGKRQGIADKTCAVNVLRPSGSGGWSLESATVAHLSQAKQSQYITSNLDTG